jgi:fused signal recognition particle receptor
MKDKRTKKGLEKTRKSFGDKLNLLISSFRKIDKDFFEELEEILILSDMGVQASAILIERLIEYTKLNKISEPEKVKEALVKIIKEEIEEEKDIFKFPSVLLVVGVNGVGKTTAIGKLAFKMKNEGKSVVLAAADTFRAAASEQLEKWAKRANVPIVKHHEGADPSAVVYDAIKSAKAKNADILICDTAGRLHNKKNLMDELSKINRVIQKEYNEASKKTYLVLDATTGQNAIVQAKSFKECVDVDGIILTKLDGSAKGGVVCGIKQTLNIPVCYIGVGEQIEDLKEFDAEDFANGLIIG